MRDHPPIPVTDLADNIDRLKANDGLKFSQEYEVSVRACRAAGAERCWPGPPWRVWKAELCLPRTSVGCTGPEPGLGACQLSLPAPERWELALGS